MRLRAILDPQIANQPSGAVEWLVWMDTRGARTIGQKRDELVQLAQGQYVAFVDDDDLITSDYVSSMLKEINPAHKPDAITFRQRVTWNGVEGQVVFGLANKNEPFSSEGVTMRGAWHVCAFRSELAKAHHFPRSNYGEDWAWARHVSADCQTESHIPRILHHYVHDQSTTAAPPPV